MRRLLVLLLASSSLWPACRAGGYLTNPSLRRHDRKVRLLRRLARQHPHTVSPRVRQTLRDAPMRRLQLVLREPLD